MHVRTCLGVLSMRASSFENKSLNYFISKFLKANEIKHITSELFRPEVQLTWAPAPSKCTICFSKWTCSTLYKNPEIFPGKNGQPDCLFFKETFP